MKSLLPEIITLVEDVSTAILPIYHSQDENLLSLKGDGSPLTKADMLAHQIIRDRLAKLTPGIPMLSEEGCDIPFADRQSWERYWLIDPIDGTKEFLERNGDFTVNIALIEYHKPVLGVVGVPVLNTVYYATQHEGAWKKMANALLPLAIRKFNPEEKVLIVASRRHGQSALEKISKQYPNCESLMRGSSLKFCMLAEGLADLYPRLGLTSEWDTAAAQCILEAAGGKVVDLHGVSLKYNKADSYVNPYFLAIADTSMDWERFFKE